MRNENHRFILSRRILATLVLLTPVFSYGQLSPDFSKTNSITILMAEPNRKNQRYAGLEHADGHADGWTSITNVAGVACRSLSLSEEGHRKGYMYFTIDRRFKEMDVSHVRIDVEYFDGVEGQAGALGVEYDSTASGGNFNPAYTPLLPVVPLRGSGKWLKTTFHLKDAAFRNSQNGGADFRLWASPPELCVSRVRVTVDPLLRVLHLKPMAFSPAGEAKLGGWNVQWDSGSKPSFATCTNQNGSRSLEIRAPGSSSAGSWRTSVLLEPGDYRFVGKARMEGVDAGAEGVGLRLSYRGGGKMVSEAPDWTSLTHDFTINSTSYVELVCQFRASQGIARFDVDSLKLTRKTKAASQ